MFIYWLSEVSKDYDKSFLQVLKKGHASTESLRVSVLVNERRFIMILYSAPPRPLYGI